MCVSARDLGERQLAERCRHHGPVPPTTRLALLHLGCLRMGDATFVVAVGLLGWVVVPFRLTQRL